MANQASVVRSTAAGVTHAMISRPRRYLKSGFTTIDKIDLSKRWNNADSTIWSYIHKGTSLSGPGPPSLNDGAIFSNGSSFWLYGGSVSEVPRPQPPIPPNGIWRYDLSSGQWSQPPTGGDPVQRLVQGIPVQASGSKSFNLGGFKSPLSDAVFNAQPDSMQYPVQGLLVFDENEQGFSNVSTTDLNQAGTLVGGFLSSIDTLGNRGVLVAFGGYSFAVGTAFDLSSLGEVFSSIQRPMQNVTVYDIANDRWYQQLATGDVPAARHHGCSIAVSAADQTSHSIYVFGGSGSDNSKDNDGNVYVLSLPSFMWIRVTQDSDQRFRHRCHLMGKNHFLVVGGLRPGNTAFHADISGCDSDPKFTQGLGIFSLNDHTWKTDYDPVIGSAPYRIHPAISKVIGGNATGGATKRSPEHEFSSNELRDLFGLGRQESNTAPKNSSIPVNPGKGSQLASDSKPSNSLTIQAIAGIVAGVVGACVLIVGVLWFLRRRRRLFHQPSSQYRMSKGKAELVASIRCNPLEVDAGPVVPEVGSGNTGDFLARTYQTHEMSNSSQRYELPAWI
ncbi:MAG: hypothetical protein Q9170_001862 [Blastenia crenularia]